MEQTTTPPSAARRSERAHQAVLTSAIEVFKELGYARLTIDAIASRARVSKATIYRWWPNKAAVVMEGFLAAVEPEIAFPDSGSLRRDLISQMVALARLLEKTRLGQMAVSLLAESQHDHSLRTAFRDQWIAPRRAVARAVIERAIERGEIDGGVDVDVVLDLLYGPLYYRLLVGLGPLDRPYIDGVVQTVLEGIAIPGK
jgi:AcrR family transcriptional regulator